MLLEVKFLPGFMCVYVRVLNPLFAQNTRGVKDIQEPVILALSVRGAPVGSARLALALCCLLSQPCVTLATLLLPEECHSQSHTETS